MSSALSRALLGDIRKHLPRLEARTGETEVAGALRTAKADFSETHPLDGLRIAVELKPVHLAVGRALWNRFGDIRTFPVNIHLKFPFAVVGGVLTVPTFEEVPGGGRKSTQALISRAVDRLVRIGGRRHEAEAPHLLEAAAVVVFDPVSAKLDEGFPSEESGLRWPAFVRSLAEAYKSRFEL